MVRKKEGEVAKAQDRGRRLAAELRANLAKRKEQARGRRGAADEASEVRDGDAGATGDEGDGTD